MDLPDAEYHISGSGYVKEIKIASDRGERFFSYVIVTKDGIRGMWNPNKDAIKIRSNLPFEEDYISILTNDRRVVRDGKIDYLLDT